VGSIDVGLYMCVYACYGWYSVRMYAILYMLTLTRAVFTADAVQQADTEAGSRNPRTAQGDRQN